jgi:hypothetical protein
MRLKSWRAKSANISGVIIGVPGSLTEWFFMAKTRLVWH